jgi:hypothetical protein
MIYILGLAATFGLGFMVYVPFMVFRWAKSGNPRALVRPDGKRWLALTICAGEIIGFGFILQFAMTFFLPQYQLSQLPIPVLGLGIILVFVGTGGFVYARAEFDQLRND